jgi:hypothetical protein
MARSAMVLLMVVLPGGFFIVGGWVLAQLLATRMREEQGPQPRRLARAVAALNWRDVLSQARRLVG